MMHAIEWRDTSRKVDEVLCMAIQLNLDVGSVTKISDKDHEGRMQALLGQIPYFPADLMFTHGPRICQPPFRWSPRRLLGYKDNYSFIPAAKADTPMGQRTDKGLRVKYPSFQIQQGPMPASPFLFFRCVPVDVQGRFKATPGDVQKAFGMAIDTADPENLSSWHESNMSSLLGSGDLTVLIGMTGMHGNPATQEPGMIGLIIKKERQEGGIIYGTPWLTVVLFEIPPELAERDGPDVRYGIQFPTRRFCIG